MNKLRLSLSLLLLAGAVVFLLRRQSLRQLRTEQEQLRQQSEEVSTLETTIAQTKTAPVSSTSNGLSAAERSELLRLRGQVGALRQELAQETAQLEKISRAPRPRASGTPEQPALMTEAAEKGSQGRQATIAVMLYASDHEDQLPASMADAKEYFGAVTPNWIDNFEYLGEGLKLSSIKSADRTIVLREKRPWVGADNRWHRVYAFADGHVETAQSESEDFTRWELASKTVLGGQKLTAP